MPDEATSPCCSALKVCDDDPAGGYALAYDGARKGPDWRSSRTKVQADDARRSPRGAREVRAQVDPLMGRG